MISVAILTISDRSFMKIRQDISGPALKNAAQELQWDIVAMEVVPDEITIISQKLVAWSDSGKINLILTTGGTGFAPRDVTPEATQAIIHRLAPGLAEAMRAFSLTKTPHAMLARGVCGIRNQTLIVNLPGNPTAAVENFQFIQMVIPHAVELLSNSAESEFHHKIKK